MSSDDRVEVVVREEDIDSLLVSILKIFYLKSL